MTKTESEVIRAAKAFIEGVTTSSQVVPALEAYQDLLRAVTLLKKEEEEILPLTEANVKKVFSECIFQDSEVGATPVMGECRYTKFAFHPIRLMRHRNVIVQLLLSLPTKFMESNGAAGSSVLQGSYNRTGEMWASHELIVEKLLALGEAIGVVEPLTKDRDLWINLPEGEPMYCVMDKRELDRSMVGSDVSEIV